MKTKSVCSKEQLWMSGQEGRFLSILSVFNPILELI